MYNREGTVAQSIGSLQHQTYPHWQLIIIDDKSSDQSIARVKEIMATEPRIRLIESKINQGPGGARNTGISEVTTKYLAFLDSDDLWAPEKLEVQLNFMETSGAAFTYTGYRTMDENNQLSQNVTPSESAQANEIMANNFIVTSSVMMDLEQTGHLQFPLTATEDLSLWVQVLKKVKKAYLVPQELIYFRKWSGSISKGKINQAKHRWLYLRNDAKLGLIQSMFYFAKYATLTSYKYAVQFRQDQSTAFNCTAWLSALPRLELKDNAP